MRKLIVCNIMSLDGYYEGPGNNVMALPMDSAFDAYNLERIRGADTVLLGARSYQLFSGFWPAIADKDDASDVHREFSAYYSDVDKAVISDSYSPPSDAPWYATTTVVRRAKAEDWVSDIKEASGRDVVMFASRTTWNGLLAAGLVDELHLVVGATALGGGTPIFDEPVTGLEPIETRCFDGSTNVLLSYGTGRHQAQKDRWQ